MNTATDYSTQPLWNSITITITITTSTQIVSRQLMAIPPTQHRQDEERTQLVRIQCFFEQGYVIDIGIGIFQRIHCGWFCFLEWAQCRTMLSSDWSQLCIYAQVYLSTIVNCECALGCSSKSTKKLHNNISWTTYHSTFHVHKDIWRGVRKRFWVDALALHHHMQDLHNYRNGKEEEQSSD